jgi:hypothetical protein
VYSRTENFGLDFMLGLGLGLGLCLVMVGGVG